MKTDALVTQSFLMRHPVIGQKIRNITNGFLTMPNDTSTTILKIEKYNRFIAIHKSTICFFMNVHNIETDARIFRILRIVDPTISLSLLCTRNIQIVINIVQEYKLVDSKFVIIFLIRFEQWVSTQLGLVLCRIFLITLGSMG